MRFVVRHTGQNALSFASIVPGQAYTASKRRVPMHGACHGPNRLTDSDPAPLIKLGMTHLGKGSDS
jgi:hypothetical protein